MRRKLCLFLMAASTGLLVQGQSRLKFENNNMVGLLAGSSTSSWQLQTVNGVSYKTYSVGVGVGIDYYYFKTIPLFVDIRKNIFDKGQTPFVYVDAGTNIPSKKDEFTTWQTISYDAGLYYDFGIGYKWNFWKKLYLNSSFGYSQKKYGVKEEYQVGGDPGVSPDKYNYRLQRFSVKFGLGF